MDHQPKPPKPKTNEPEGLAEVERALSILKGRHPESERMRREDDERVAKKIAEQNAAHDQALQKVRTKRLLYVAGIGAGVVVAITIAGVFRTELARRGKLEQAADPYRSMGFVVVETSSRGEPNKLEASVPAGCLLATATTPKTRVKITHAGGAVEAATGGPVLTCLCEGGRVTVEGDTKSNEGLALLRVDANVIGGSRAFAFLPFTPGATGKTDTACAEASLDAWLESKKWMQQDAESSAPSKGAGPKPNAGVNAATSDAWLAARPNRAELKAAGFKVTDIVTSSAPFGVVDIAAGSCVLIVPENPHDKPSLRLKSGTIAIGPAAGSQAWCTSTDALAILQREEDASKANGEIVLLAAPAVRLGGLFGAREVAERAKLAPAAIGLPSSDYGWSAKQLLVSCAIPETLISVSNTPDLGDDAEARIIALSVDKPNMVTPDTPPEVFSFCDPPLIQSTTSMCVFSGPQKWRVSGADTVAGLARAKLPFWLFGLQGVSEPAALKLETQLIALARRLRRDGFEPTTIEAVTELDKGAEVLGRAKEDAFVAVALAPTPPWVFPYTDSATEHAWSIEAGDDPRVVPIQPLERVTVTPASEKVKLPPKATRRTVVFRRQKQ